MVVLQPIKPGPPRVHLSLKRGRARRALSLLGNNNTQQNLQLAESLLTISAEEFANKWNFDPIQGVPLASGRFQWTPVTPMTSPDPTAVTPSDAMGSVVTSCDLASSSADIPNPAEDNSKEQKTCVTLPTSTPSASCQVSGGQVNDLPKNQTTQEMETVKAKSDSDSHTCCSRTCACDFATCDKNTEQKDNGSEKDSLKKPSQSVKTEADSGIDSDDSVVDEQESNNPTSSTKTDCLQSMKLRQTCITEFVRPQKLATFKVPEPLSHSSSYSKKRPASSLQDQLNQPPHKKVLLHLRA